MPKEPVTIRLSDEWRSALRDLAENRGSTVSKLVTVAVEQYLTSQGEGVVDPGGEVMLTADDIEGMIPVLRALEVPVSLDVFLRLIELRRKSE